MINIIGENESGADGLLCPLRYYLRNSKSTFLSPVYFLNNYIDTFTEYSIKYLGGETQSGDNELFEIESTINTLMWPPFYCRIRQNVVKLNLVK